MKAANESLAKYRLVPLTDRDIDAVVQIVNRHIASGFAAYPEKPVSEEAMAALLEQTKGYAAVAAKGSSGALLGFGFLRPYSPASTFSHTAQIAYFIDAAHVRRRIGTAILHHLEEEARKQGSRSSLPTSHLATRAVSRSTRSTDSPNAAGSRRSAGSGASRSTR